MLTLRHRPRTRLGNRALTPGSSQVRDDAGGHIYQVFRLQAAVLAYADILMYASIIAFIMIPLSFS
jgi:hypothetical protein